MNTIGQFKDTTFPVKEVPAIGIPTGTKSKKIDSTGYKFIVREDTNEVISCMTDEYQLIKNEDVLEKAIPIINDRGGLLVEEKLFGSSSRTTWKWKFPEISVDIGGGDLVNPTVSISNSYDGSMEASAIAGAFRIVCSNGMIIGFLIGKNSVKHSIWSKNMDIEEIIGSVVNGVENILKTDFPKLRDTKVNKLHVAKLLKLFPENQMQSLFNKMISKPPRTYWDLLNAATWVATHQMKRDVEATHKFESKLYPLVNGFANQEIAKA